MSSPFSPRETPFFGLDLATVETLEERSRARLLGRLLTLLSVVMAAVAAIDLLSGSWHQGALAAAGAAGYALIFAFARRLGVGTAAGISVACYFLLALGAMALGEGVHDVAVIFLPGGILIGALLLPRRALVPIFSGALAATAALGVAQSVGALPVRGQPATLEDVAVAVLLLLVAGLLTVLVVGDLEAMIAKRQRAERALIASRDELAARNQALEQVNELASRLHRSLDVAEIARQAVAVLVRHRSPPQVGFYLLDERGEKLRMVADHGFDSAVRAAGETLPVEGSLSGVAVREGRLIWSPSLARDPRVEPQVGAALAASGIDAALVIPLTFGTRVLGTVNLLFREPPEWTELEMDTLRGIGQAVSLALTNARHVAGLEHQAFHDPLTGLPNRAAFHRELSAQLAAVEGGGTRLAVMLFDLRRFREINDALGHPTGDRLLVALAGRLARRAGQGRFRLFRLGGDEFAVVASGGSGAEETLAQARELLAVLARPCEIDGMSLEIEVAGGLALFPLHGRDSHELLRCADVALYRAKRNASGVELYDVSQDEHTAERLALAADLARAVREGALALHFQPMVALADGRVVGFEALVRWPHPRLGMVMPADFLSVAESSDLIHPLTYWVVEEAVTQLDRWQRAHPPLARASMAVNLSVRNLLDGHCAARIEEIVRRIGIDPGRLELELTETAVMSDPEAAVTMLGRITGTGARLAIDDFGTGYSSLAYLRRFPVHGLKIDRSFVAGLGEGRRNLAIVRSTLDLARNLDLFAVAEGVEDSATARCLRELGCEVAQGDLFASAAPAAELEARLAAAHWRLPAA